MINEELKQRLIGLLSTAGWNLFTDKTAKIMIADHLIANGVTIRERGEWIPVTERLPEKMQEALCYRGDCRGGLVNVYTYFGDDRWEDDYGYFGTAESDGITHWMPLPEAPETEKGGAE